LHGRRKQPQQGVQNCTARRLNKNYRLSHGSGAGVWERQKLILLTGLLILSLTSLTLYLLTKEHLKQAQSAQTRLSGMLINAAEKERGRVAAELHDDFSQRLAIIALKLENLAETVSPLSEEAGKIRELVNSVSELGTDLHTLSHRLHSSMLESLGLVPAIRALCKEFSAQQRVEVDFTSDDIPRLVDPRAALCIFRIVQEGLRNSKKHSGAKQVLVSLRVDVSGLIVSVLDKGCGFNMKKLSHNGRLGVRIMEERIHLLGGKFKIQSAPGKGTTVTACVPLAPNSLGELRLRDQTEFLVPG
jgi:signal transduction histidine kinase